jgi:hypothetical protein
MSMDVKLPPPDEFLPTSGRWTTVIALRMMQDYARAAVLADRAESERVLRVALEALDLVSTLHASVSDTHYTQLEIDALRSTARAALAAIRAHLPPQQEQA